LHEITDLVHEMLSVCAPLEMTTLGIMGDSSKAPFKKPQCFGVRGVSGGSRDASLSDGCSHDAY